MQRCNNVSITYNAHKPVFVFLAIHNNISNNSNIGNDINCYYDYCNHTFLLLVWLFLSATAQPSAKLALHKVQNEAASLAEALCEVEQVTPKP